MPSEYGGVASPKVKPGELTSVQHRKARKENREAKDRAWARAVFQRHGRRCKVVGFGGHFGRVDPHHVLKKSTHPEARHDPKNGLPACRLHHNLIDVGKIAVVALEPEKGTFGRLRFEEGPAG